MEHTINRSIIWDMVKELDLPEHVIEQTVKRYKSLGEWFGRKNSSFREIDVDIFPQGSFALGTTIKPINNQEEYDLDMGCKVNNPDFKNQYSQEQLKKIIGIELEKYRIAKGIKQELDEKHRCWRLEYKDEINFHLDIVPCIPLQIDNQSQYKQQLQDAYQYHSALNEAVVNLAINITDDRHENYSLISQDWQISNPEGYLKWFEDRMIQSQSRIFNERASVTPVPVYNQKTILQRCIQLMKRHRDNMFGDDERKPISIIITTLAARAYSGEQNLEEALINIIEKMPNYINHNTPRVPNPVNPIEDFTDRWDMPEGVKIDLEGNFKNWLLQAKVDFKNLLTTKFALNLGTHLDKHNYNQVNQQTFARELPKNPPKPWSDGY
jgi:hypothetical protein